MTINSKSYMFAGSVAKATLSIGNSNGNAIFRTITNLAAGRVDESSTDAVNGSQLSALVKAIESLNARLDQLNK
ncbi:hemagglutinin [compost metagenome]